MNTGIYIFIGVYVFVNSLITLYVYNKSKIFYQPAYMTQEDGSKSKVSLHDKYKEFKKNDHLSAVRIFIGINLFFWIKIILLISTAISLIIALSICSCLCKGNTRIVQILIKIALKFINLVFGVRLHQKRVDCTAEYKKYFGDDYEIKYDKGYSAMISNHTGWIDICIYLNKFVCGFIAKDDVASMPLVGTVSKQINCVFVKREDANNRHAILDLIKTKQEEFMSNSKLSPFLIFPEGTVTSGKHVLRFKKGAFNSLLPLKPVIIKTTLNDNFHLSVGSAGLFVHLIRTLCYFYHDIDIIELPVMTPTKFMYEHYSKLYPELKEDWEKYAEVARELYCSLGKFEKSEKTLRDSKEYSEIINGEKKKVNLLKRPEPDKSTH